MRRFLSKAKFYAPRNYFANMKEVRTRTLEGSPDIVEYPKHVHQYHYNTIPDPDTYLGWKDPTFDNFERQSANYLETYNFEF